MKSSKSFILKAAVVVFLIVIAVSNIIKIKTENAVPESELYASQQTEESGGENSEQAEEKGILPFGIKIGKSNLIVIIALGCVIAGSHISENRKTRSHRED